MTTSESCTTDSGITVRGGPRSHPTVTGPRAVTRGGETYTEWEYISPSGYVYRLTSRRDELWLREEKFDVGIELDAVDLGCINEMLADAQQYLTGGQR